MEKDYWFVRYCGFYKKFGQRTQGKLENIAQRRDIKI
jgi:hypothetical protein